MAKSVWKFLRTNQLEIYMYIDEFKLIREKQGLQIFGRVKNNMTINTINYMHLYTFHLGKSYMSRRFYELASGLKTLAFLKFKKPFSFQPKKKKKKKNC